MSDMDHLCFDTTKIDKIQDLLERGVTVYPYKFERTDTIDEIKKRFSDIGHEKSADEVSTAGRVYVVRQHGKTIFADIGDSDGRIQLYLRKNDLGEEEFNLFEAVHRRRGHHRRRRPRLPDKDGGDHHLGRPV